MTTIRDAPAWYDAHAGEVVDTYESIDSGRLHAWLADLLPAAASVVVDVGAGSGRDAAWLAGLGHQVLAIEPSAAMRAAGQALHPSERIRWLDDRLPTLAATSGVVADVVLLAASWQHVPPDGRDRAFASLAGLLRPGGLLAITLRQGPCEGGRHMHPVSLEEVERLGQAHRMTVLRVEHRPDRSRRAGVSWTNVALRSPDAAARALADEARSGPPATAPASPGVGAPCVGPGLQRLGAYRRAPAREREHYPCGRTRTGTMPGAAAPGHGGSRPGLQP